MDTPAVNQSKEILQKLDKDSNTRVFTGWQKKVVNALLIGSSVYMLLLTLLFTDATAQTRRTTFVGLVVLIGFLIFPAYKAQTRKINFIPWYDFALSGVGASCFFFFTVNQRTVIETNGTMLPMLYIVVAIIGILCLAELCRRAVGLPILFVVGAFVVYLFIYYAQNPRLNMEKILSQVIYNLFYNISDGVFGAPILACSSFIVLFIIMGAMLEKTGIAAFFIDLANSVAGSSDGGPAKVAVIASGLMGMISGSSVANTVGSGSVTIPMMKKSGYKPAFAAAVEASASTGGQIMPPIMGAAAFLMAEIAGVPYQTIVIAAILPAVLYFMGIFIMVHFEAKKNGLKGLPKEAVPNFLRLLLKKGYLLLPIVVLIVCMNYFSAGMSACIAILAALIIGLLPEELSVCHFREIAGGGKGRVVLAFVYPLLPLAAFLAVALLGGDSMLATAVLVGLVLCFAVSFLAKDGNMSPQKLADGLRSSAQSAVSVGVACAMAGMIAAVVTATSLASKITPLIMSLANFNPFLALFAAMICCIILGMGVPTTANYVIMASTIAPILIQVLNIPVLAAHMFVFYFGIVADITPPVALAAYAGSAIAGSNPFKTGVTATKLAIAAFITPYLFALDPQATLLLGYTTASPVLTVIAVCTSLLGMFAISSGLQGYCFGKIGWVRRVLFLVSGLLLIYPESYSDVVGAVGVAALLAVCFLLNRKQKKAGAN
ncbi:MAG: TRAP transporter fused permease subunit [Clostridia bacterium]|nr:TRAP transporter fused permease subunit [Clostridia bacterium]